MTKLRSWGKNISGFNIEENLLLFKGEGRGFDGFYYF